MGHLDAFRIGGSGLKIFYGITTLPTHVHSGAGISEVTKFVPQSASLAGRDHVVCLRDNPQPKLQLGCYEEGLESNYATTETGDVESARYVHVHMMIVYQILIEFFRRGATGGNFSP